MVGLYAESRAAIRIDFGFTGRCCHGCRFGELRNCGATFFYSEEQVLIPFSLD